MSRHSKWAKVKHYKGAVDQKRGASFTKHAKMIEIAARQGGGDPNFNPTLRTAIEKAKEDNTPVANIERAIKKGTGELKEGAANEEIFYEAFGPEGVALYIHVITDNKNRALQSVKLALRDYGGSLAGAGSVAWMLEKKIPASAGRSEIVFAAQNMTTVTDEEKLKPVIALLEALEENEDIAHVYHNLS